jgi:hypothetical protein
LDFFSSAETGWAGIRFYFGVKPPGQGVIPLAYNVALQKGK